jgi:hypothetical protein
MKGWECLWVGVGETVCRENKKGKALYMKGLGVRCGGLGKQFVVKTRKKRNMHEEWGWGGVGWGGEKLSQESEK